MEESALTGESVPVNKDAGLTLAEDNIPLGDMKNMAFSSTLITNGRGTGVAVATGMDTQIGHIANMLGEADEKTPLQKKLSLIHISSGSMQYIQSITLLRADGDGVYNR